jgi:transposase InsO family protein
VHADIVGPFRTSHRGSFKYLLVLVDDHSRLKMAYPMQNKGQAINYVRRFVSALNALCSRGKTERIKVVGSLHTDNAGEFLSREFSEFLDTELIKGTTCPPHVHSLNGVAERAIRSIMERVRSNLVASQWPVSFWPYLVDHALDVLNRTTGDLQTPSSRRTRW